VLSHYYGHDDVTLGAYKGPFGRDREKSPIGAVWRTGPYVPALVKDFSPGPVRSSADVDDALLVYRRALAAASDHSVAIANIGFSTNLYNLLRSPADAISPLNGSALVALKVKLVVWQGGWYPHRHRPAGLAKRKPEDEFNWGCGRRWFGPSLEGCEGTAAYVSSNMPSNVEQVFSEAGLLFPSGGALIDCAPQTNPCRQAMVHTLQGWNQEPRNGRASWDQHVTLMAVRGVEGAGGHKLGEGGVNVIDPDGTNRWREGSGSRQSYVAMDGDEAWFESLWGRIDDDELVLDGMYEDVRWGRAPPILDEIKGEIDRLLCMRPRGD